MRDTLRLCARYIGVSIRSQMQYRGSFLMQSFGQFLAIMLEFVAIWALFDRFGNLRGWTLAEVAIFCGIVHTGFALAESLGRGFDMFPQAVKSGDFDRLLVRPRSTALQVGCRELHLRCGRLLKGLIVLGWGIHASGVAWPLPKVLLLLATIACGCCVFVGLFVIQATLAFWTVESLEILNTVTYGGTETAQFPLDVYKPWFRRFFTFVVPLACVSYYPTLAILEHPGRPSPEALLWLAPLVGVVFLRACLWFWSFGERHYMSTGS